MNRPAFFKGIIWFAFALTSAGLANGRPNIVILVADDLGWADVGYHGSPIKTPNIDKLCREGQELDQFYVAPMCTPTRVALLTGRYWSRLGNTSPSNERVLPWGTPTLASVLRDVGYETAITGKWHLGSKPEWGPRKFGFDHSYGCLAGGVNPWSHLYKPGEYSRTWHRNDRLIDEKGHATDLIAAEAVRFIEKERAEDKQFFLYVPFTAVHTPFDEPQESLDAASHIPEDRRQYAASVQHLDRAIGQIVAALKRKKARENTLIIFFSDNGGTNGDDSARYPDTKRTGKINGLNTPLRGWKKDVYEGGIRVPCFVNWGQGFPGPKKIEMPMHVVDWMPTLRLTAGAIQGWPWKMDGQLLGPILSGRYSPDDPRTLYFNGVGGQSSALRHGDLKLVAHYKRKKEPVYELYDLATDPNEKRDLATERPKDVARLIAALAIEAAKDNESLPNDPDAELSK